jgi:hypothetical protein
MSGDSLLSLAPGRVLSDTAVDLAGNMFFLEDKLPLSYENDYFLLRAHSGRRKHMRKKLSNSIMELMERDHGHGQKR